MEERSLKRESFEPKRKRLNLTSPEAETEEPLATEGVDITDGHHRHNYHRDTNSHYLNSDELGAAVDDKCSPSSQVDGMEAKTSGFKFSSELSLESMWVLAAKFHCIAICFLLSH